jgi:hypothetical protein
MSDKKPLASELGEKVFPITNGNDTLHPSQPDDTTDVQKAGEALYEKIAGMSHDLLQSDKGDPAKWGS